MLNNIFKMLLLGLVVSGCSINNKYSSDHHHDRTTTPVAPIIDYNKPIYSEPTYNSPRHRRPPKRLAPVAPAKRSNQPIYSEPTYRPPKKRPLKKIAPSSPATRLKNNRTEPNPRKNISRPKYLKQPSSNYVPNKPNSIKSYIAKGYATQYQLAENGIRTTSGQIYDMYNMTAAHVNLPLMSNVRVKNLRTGRSVIVTINDRLYHNQKIIKLSYIAANSLNLLRNPSQLLEIRGL
ncbi:MAG: RlpA-like double-psi beta-barrel domain-containing protein [Candidatus Marithrix sp.]